mgnify:CR=1 FL=1
MSYNLLANTSRMFYTEEGTSSNDGVLASLYYWAVLLRICVCVCSCAVNNKYRGKYEMSGGSTVTRRQLDWTPIVRKHSRSRSWSLCYAA